MSIDHYTHTIPADDEPDTRPGSYYVSARNEEGKYILIYGPFPNHQDALDAVGQAKWKAYQLDPRSHWYSYGTARAPEDYREPGKLNEWLPPISGQPE